MSGLFTQVVLVGVFGRKKNGQVHIMPQLLRSKAPFFFQRPGKIGYCPVYFSNVIIFPKVLRRRKKHSPCLEARVEKSQALGCRVLFFRTSKALNSEIMSPRGDYLLGFLSFSATGSHRRSRGGTRRYRRTLAPCAGHTIGGVEPSIVCFVVCGPFSARGKGLLLQIGPLPPLAGIRKSTLPVFGAVVD